ncbi:histidinol-phosphate transaminase [Alkalibaculum sp. M08DMB]|uniref:Histidinol-phosphate aminotransferase n=1 Tax=Alkalibaculum sporogenes TaxID=2655001 RepID=A0A6A7K5P0_9FIRM|nr:histidinol-phosphate transaminase [Alkalibaculum sporogenes]MPW24661.1 histidinol-phosphate transaminase [Alkalibaculum sporogenes]
MSKYWSRLAQNLEPYVPGEQPQDKKYIKLNTNENPYPPSNKVIDAIKLVTDDKLSLYPDPNGSELKEALANYYNLDKDQVFLGNGSDEVLAFSFMAFFDSSESIIFPDITYSFYTVYANIFKINYELVPLNEDFTLPIKELYKKNGGVIFPNPNAPTGNCIPLEDIEKVLIKNINRVVIVDEAYIDFGGDSAVALVDKYPNLLVIQTFSKSRSLAGLRVGYALGNKDLIEGLNRVKNSVNSYTLDRLALKGAIAAINDENYFQETRNKIMDTRKRITSELIKIGFNVIDSKSNFLFINHSSIKAVDIFMKLRERAILVRYFKMPRIDNYLRVTIGNDKEMDIFIREVCKIVYENNL